MARNDTRMADIFDAFAGALIKRLEDGEDVVTKDGVVKINCSAATLKVIKDFLVDNDITCVPTKDNALGDLVGTVASKRLPFPSKAE